MNESKALFGQRKTQGLRNICFCFGYHWKDYRLIHGRPGVVHLGLTIWHLLENMLYFF